MSDIKIVSKLQKIPIKDLHVQYVPVLNPDWVWHKDMSVLNSPHVKLIETIKNVGFNWNILMNTIYAKWRRNRRECGLHKWTDEKIKDHIKVRWSIYESIRKYGFNYRKCRKKPVIVLKEPFWKTRFGFNETWLSGCEIWDGMGRTSAMYCAGHKYVYGCYAVDAKPGTCDKGHFEKKLSSVRDMEW